MPRAPASTAFVAPGALALHLLLGGCNEHPIATVALESRETPSEGVAIAVNKDVDILFVIDNSGSMAEEQGTLAQNFAAFIDVLERPDVAANYRIGLTTTDNGNPLCLDTTPEGGALRLQTCRARAQEFVPRGQMTPGTELQVACLDVCPYDEIELLPTRTHVDPNAAPRPWLESIAGETNVGMGRRADDGRLEPVTAVQALQCFGPQGVDGCGFESHLESMWKALARQDVADEASYGFLRPDALLSVIHVTDEVDCSARSTQRAVFLTPDQCELAGIDPATCTQALWSDPSESGPTSALCWRAGTACTPRGDGTYDCRPADVGPDGREVADPADAVLFPLTRYVEQLTQIEAIKRARNPAQEVLVAVIAGVPADGGAGADPVYADALADPAFQADFGIGPGCASAAGKAVPPVRLAAFAEAFAVDDTRNLFSVCSASYAPALEAIADAIADQLAPACLSVCVADRSPGDGVVEPECTLTESTPDGQKQVIPPCVPTCGGADCGAGEASAADGARIPAGATACARALVDPDGTRTPTPLDDMTRDASGAIPCAIAGANVEFAIEREGAAAAGAAIVAQCLRSDQPRVDCPDLP
jgi:hypothetical protein